jgi:hypothetical protein
MPAKTKLQFTSILEGRKTIVSLDYELALGSALMRHKGTLYDITEPDLGHGGISN